MTAPEMGTTDADARKRLARWFETNLTYDRFETWVDDEWAGALIEAFPVLAALPAPAARTGDTEREALRKIHAAASSVAAGDSLEAWAAIGRIEAIAARAAAVRAAAAPDTPDAEVVAPTTGCGCLGHRMPGVWHVVACCDQPHVPDTPDDAEDGAVVVRAALRGER